MNRKLWIIAGISLASAYQHIQPAPFGLFEPYDINIRLRKPGRHHWSLGVLGEKSYNVKGYATDDAEDDTFLVNPLQIYEASQNSLAMYQTVQAENSSMVQLLNSITAGSGGGASNTGNGLFIPTGTFCVGQVAVNAIFGLSRDFFVGAYLPMYGARLHQVHWDYRGDNTLFSGQDIEQLVANFQYDMKHLFGLNIGGWKQVGLGDLTILFEWQKDFHQLRPVLKCVQPNVRIGFSLPTSAKTNTHNIMAPSFGNDGSISIPFGGGLNLNLAQHIDFGFASQFWYIFSNQNCRRIKTFDTQTSLLFPTVTEVIKQYAFIQNFDLYAQANFFNKRLALKFCYQYWRKGDDTITPISADFNHEIANSARPLAERTQHDVFLALTYSPCAQDFKRVFPQAQLFWKGAVKGTRAALASTAGAQFSLIF